MNTKTDNVILAVAGICQSNGVPMIELLREDGSESHSVEIFNSIESFVEFVKTAEDLNVDYNVLSSGGAVEL